MRPIDAEPLEYLFGISDEDNFFYLMLKNAPTINVISVEWIREFDLYYTGISGGSPYMKALIEAWQKEQEAR